MNKLTPYLIIAALAIVSLFLGKKLVDANHDANNYENAIKIAHDSTTHYKNKYGETVAKTMVMELTTAQLQRNITELGIDKTILQSQIKRMRDLVTAYQSKAISKGEILTVMHDSTSIKDSIVYHYKDFDYRSKYLNLRGYYKLNDSAVHISYRHFTPISIEIHKQSDGLFKGYHFEATAVAEDINTYFDNQKVVMIKTNTPFYQKTGFKIAIGTVIGFLLGKQ